MAKRTKYSKKTKLEWLPGLPGTGYDEHAYVGTIFGILSVAGKDCQYYGMIFNNKRIELPDTVRTLKDAMVHMELVLKKNLEQIMAQLEE